MDTHSRLTSAVLAAAQLVPDLPTDLAANIAALKARADQEPSRDPEDELAAALAGEMGPYMQEVAEQIVNGKQPDTRNMDDRILVLLLLALIGAATANTLQRGRALGVGLSIDEVNRAASQWAQDYSYNLVRGINDTTRQAIRDAVLRYTTTPGMTVDDVTKLLEPTFGKQRASTIATTEITRAYSQAAHITQSQLADKGVIVKQRWVTWRDDRVCPICAPLHNSFDWDVQFIFGPPAHVNCRCWLESVRAQEA
jgi:SPP1 gp7 family putative phage head morphogenesis protein